MTGAKIDAARIFSLALVATACLPLRLSAAEIGDTFTWKNTGSSSPVASSAKKPVRESNFSLLIPAATNLPVGTSLQIDEIRLASVNPRLVEDFSSPCMDGNFLSVNGVRSDLCQFGGPNLMRSNDKTSDPALVYRFSSPCFVRVGERYAADEGNSAETGLALLWKNGRPLYSRREDRGSCRYVRCADGSGGVISSRGLPGYEPVYEVTATVVSGVVSGNRSFDVVGSKMFDFGASGVFNDLTLTGSGMVRPKSGRLAVFGLLTVRGSVTARSEDLDLANADVVVEKGASFTYAVNADRQSVRSITGPGRFAKTGVGELWVESPMSPRHGLVSGGVTLEVRDGWLVVNSFNADPAWGDARIELGENGELGCLGGQHVEGRLSVRYDGEGDKLVFHGMDSEIVRLWGKGSFAQVGPGRLQVCADWYLSGPVTVESHLTFARAVGVIPTEIGGTGTVALGDNDRRWAAEDGMVTHLVDFNGTVTDCGPKPFAFLCASSDFRQYVPSRNRRAYRLNMALADSLFYAKSAPFEPGDFTFVVRAKTECANKALLVTFGAMTKRAVGLRSDAEGRLSLIAWSGGRKVFVSKPATVERPAETYHTYALVHDSARGVLAFVADDMEVDTFPVEDSAMFASFEGFQFGDAFGGVYDGESVSPRRMFLDELRIYRKALSPSRIGRLFAESVNEYDFGQMVADHPYECATVVLAVVLLLAVVFFRVKLVRDSLKAQRLFFSSVSHDIRTPLNAIVGFAELIEAGQCTGEQQKEYVRTIRTSGGLLTRIVDDVLDLSKLEGGNLQLSPVPTDIAALVREVGTVFSVQQSQKPVTFVQNVAEMPTLVIDASRFRQVAFNLIGNAFKYTDRGSVAVNVGWKENVLEFSVSDTGRGISKKDRRRILNPFVQVADSNHRDGAGLGLSICERLVKLMGGRLLVSSEVGRGSTFTIRMPASAAPTEPEKKPATEPTGKVRLSFDAKHILVVDDSKVNVSVLTATLKKCGKESVFKAYDGREALEVLKAHPEIDLVLTDLWMPAMDGLGLVQAIRGEEKHKDLPVVLITADIDARREHARGGFTGILIKPISTAVIAALFEKGS